MSAVDDGDKYDVVRAGKHLRHLLGFGATSACPPAQKSDGRKLICGIGRGKCNPIGSQARTGRFGNRLLASNQIPGPPLEAAEKTLAQLDGMLKPVR